MQVRQEQVDALGEAAKRQFQADMLHHLCTFAPAHCSAVGEPALRSVITAGMRRAAGYGFVCRGPVRLFLELSVQLGSDFDSDPQLEWVTASLRSEGDELERADVLYARAVNYLDAVVGPDREYEIQALRRSVKVRFDHVREVAAQGTGAMVAALRELHPQKVDYSGYAAIASIVNRAGADAAERGFGGKPEAAAVFAGLMFAFGHRCLADPQFAWIPAGIRNELEPSERAAILFERTLGYLQKALLTLQRRNSHA